MRGENVISLSSRVLAQFNGLAGLGRVTFSELCAQRGAGAWPPPGLVGPGGKNGHRLLPGRGQSVDGGNGGPRPGAPEGIAA